MPIHDAGLYATITIVTHIQSKYSRIGGTKGAIMSDGYRIADINIGESIDEQAKLAANPDVHVRMSLAKNEMTLPEIQRQLATDENLEVRWALTCNPKIVPEVQKVLAQDSAYEVRQSLAQVPGLTDVAQLLLAYDRDDFVRETLAILPGLTSRVQSMLAHDKSVDVRAALATNKLDKDVQIMLSQQEDRQVLEALADNEWVDASIIESLTKNKDEQIAEVAQTNITERTATTPPSFGMSLG